MIKSACALGFFDGVHEAHSHILSECVAYAKKHGLVSIALTFEKSPAEFFGKEIKYLTPLHRKEELMKSLGIDRVVVLPCNEETLSLSPEDFVKTILIDSLNAAALFCGFNYTFGKEAKGNTQLLKTFCQNYNVDVFVMPQMTEDGFVVSSTKIRQSLKEGDIEKANKLLTRPFELCSKVEKGKQLGQHLGFPTANLYPDSYFPTIPHGVYATKTLVDNKEYISVTNVGINPTVNDNFLRIETYILDFEEDIYHKCITVKFFKFLRAENKFNSIEELKAQIALDKKNALAYFENKL